jgi:hypothetical protein
LCRKGEQANVKYCRFHTSSDTGKENPVIGFLKTVSPYHTMLFFLGLIKSSSFKGADSGKRKIENES